MDIKMALKTFGHSISSMAKLMGITQQALSQQIGNNTITFAKIEKIAELCNTTTLDFLEAGMEDKREAFCAFIYSNGKMHTFDTKKSLREFLIYEK